MKNILLFVRFSKYQVNMSTIPLFGVNDPSWWPILCLIGLIVLCVIFTMMIVYCGDENDESSDHEFPDYESITHV